MYRDFKSMIIDILHRIHFPEDFFTGINFFYYKPRPWIKHEFRKWRRRQLDFFKYFLKKYIYTINHKRIAINYLVFVIWSGLSGAALATMIRIELAYPGSHFFKGDSIRYLQVITCHGLTMIFFVAVPLIFGFVANFFIPYHIGSKDVAYPRLNSIGFWLLPAGYILMSKPAFIRSSFHKYFEDPTFYYQINNREFFWNSVTSVYNKNYETHNDFIFWEPIKAYDMEEFDSYIYVSLLRLTQYYNPLNIDTFWRYVINQFKIREKKVYITKCSNSILTMSGWTFITPFSAKTKFTGAGAQDIAIAVVLLSGLSTTISFTNLLVTRRTLSMPGLRYRRVLLPFLSISLFLTMRMLVLITPVLGAAMIMLLMDRHWGTSFFDYAYGGDVVLFHHLFWFFGHPEVYVVIIPAFGIANMMIPFNNNRRIASKHHLIWATYIMAYMGFLVWGHHMYLIGLDHRSRSMYSTITVMISLPAIVKIVNWTLTILNGSFVIDLPVLFLNSFFFFFFMWWFNWFMIISCRFKCLCTWYFLCRCTFSFYVFSSNIFCFIWFNLLLFLCYFWCLLFKNIWIFTFNLLNFRSVSYLFTIILSWL